MTLLTISYSEFEGEDRQWQLAPVDVDPKAMLIVGTNTTGKSRFLAILRSLTQSIAALRVPADGKFTVTVKLKSGIFKYELLVSKQAVIKEHLTLNNQILLDRSRGLPTKLKFEKQNEVIESQFQDNVLAVASRQDSFQHPWFIEFAEWARKTAYYSFAVGFSAEYVMTTPDLVRLSKETSDNTGAAQIRNYAIGTYARAFTKFDSKFDKAVISDMRSLGFLITEVGIGPIHELMPEIGMDLVMLYIKEEGVVAKIPQTIMSQGLFRALALIISLNSQLLGNEGSLILIDDVGEGLDFERSSALIKLLLEKSTEHSVQILMTTNDRFVMNNVPVESWCILQRRGSEVSSFTIASHKKMFEDFKYSGLSNFDFFRSHAFVEHEFQE